MTAALRHYCRNPRCRSKLVEPTENTHAVFCTRGCYEQYHRRRCVVCEAEFKRNAEHQLICGRRRCRSEVRKWPALYRPFHHGPVSGSQPVVTPLENADFTGLKFGLRAHLPAAHCLRQWWWGDEDDPGRYHLRSPLTWPRMAWSDLGEAKRCAASLALAAIPLEAADPKLAARIKRDNETPHPMGRPLNRPLLVTMPVVEAPPIAPDSEGDPLDIPEFLRRAS